MNLIEVIRYREGYSDRWRNLCFLKERSQKIGVEGDDGRSSRFKELEILMKNCWCGSTSVKAWMNMKSWSKNAVVKFISLTWNLRLAPTWRRQGAKLIVFSSWLWYNHLHMFKTKFVILFSKSVFFFFSFWIPSQEIHYHPFVKAAIWISFQILLCHTLCILSDISFNFLWFSYPKLLIIF